MEALKQQVDQLRVEAHVDRKKVSAASKNLIEFCQNNMAADPLVTGAPANNPWQEKKTCAML